MGQLGVVKHEPKALSWVDHLEPVALLGLFLGVVRSIVGVDVLIDIANT